MNSVKDNMESIANADMSVNISTRQNRLFTIDIERDATEWDVVDILSILDDHDGYNLDLHLDDGEIVVKEADDDDD